MLPVEVCCSCLCFVESTPNVYSFIKWRCAAVFRTPRALIALPSDQGPDYLIERAGGIVERWKWVGNTHQQAFAGKLCSLCL